MLCNVHTALCWSLCTPLVCAVGCCFFVVLTFLLFPTATRCLEKYTKRARAHPPNCVPRFDTCVALPRKNRGRERFAVLYRVAAFVALGCRCLCQGTLHFRGLPLRSVFSDRNVNFKTQQQRTPCVFFCCRATLSNRSVVPQKILPSSKVEES